MDSDEGYNYEFDDEEEECSEDSVEEEPEDDTLELGEVELVDPVVAGGERDDCGGDTGGSGHGPGQEEEDYRFEVLTAEQILQHMVECIREVNEVIQVGCIYFHLTLIRHLLLMYSLNFHPSRYFDGNLDKLFSECHVINPSKKSRTRPSINTRSSAQDMPCQICYLNYPNSYFTGLECGHKFCMQCWGDYLTTKIIEEGMGQTISCPAHSCDILVDDNTVMRLITDSKVKLKYQHLITNSFVERYLYLQRT
uniref:RBR-type E3 ubiquitin transferase n=1 Tax=Gadus morhua TaxID=8049 RepID=A0A8C5ASN4_GADMO